MESKNEVIIRQEENAIVMPAVSADEALVMFRAFQDIKKKCLNEDDTQKINNNPYVKKTGWRKIKTIFNLSEEILESNRNVYSEGDTPVLQWIYRVRVKAKNGAYADAEMSCDSREPFARGKPETAIQAMAQTRAFNRAISDLVGGGEVTAEELTEEPAQAKTQPIKPSPPKEPKCVNCGKIVTEKIYNYSMDKRKMCLCYECQKLDPTKIGLKKLEEVMSNNEQEAEYEEVAG